MITCILTSHRKPKYVFDAIESVLVQEGEWQLVLMDSGGMFGDFRLGSDIQRGANVTTNPRVFVAWSGETEEQRRTTGMQGWCINECFRRGLVKGDLVCYLSDDDYYLPGAFKAFQEAADQNPDQSAWYGSVNVQKVFGDGRVETLPRLTADVVRAAGSLRGRVDGMQVCHRASLDVPWPEDKGSAPEADGWFLERLGAVTPVHPLPVVVGVHRMTPDSAFHKG